MIGPFRAWTTIEKLVLYGIRLPDEPRHCWTNESGPGWDRKCPERKWSHHLSPSHAVLPPVAPGVEGHHGPVMEVGGQNKGLTETRVEQGTVGRDRYL